MYRMRAGMGAPARPIQVYSRRRGMWGLGDYLSDCEGSNPNCSPMDQVCIANWQNVVDACEQQYVTDPNSPHNNPNASGVTAQLSTSSPQYTAELAAAGGSTQLAEQAVGETLPPGTSPAAWWGGPGATVAAGPPAAPPPAPTPAPAAPAPGTPSTAASAAPANATVSSSASAAPAGNVYVSSTPAAAGTQAGSSSTGFDLSSIPWYLWAGVAAVALFAFSK